MVGGLARVLSVARHVAGRRCQYCAAVLADPDEFPLCSGCRELLAPRVGGYCPDCGICYADTSAPVYSCLACRRSRPPWSALAFHGTYSGALRDLVHGPNSTTITGWGGSLPIWSVRPGTGMDWSVRTASCPCP